MKRVGARCRGRIGLPTGWLTVLLRVDAAPGGGIAIDIFFLFDSPLPQERLDHDEHGTNDMESYRIDYLYSNEPANWDRRK